MLDSKEVLATFQSMIAVTQPQAAYSAYVNGYKHKFTYFIRTIPDINHLLSPLVECIYERLLTAIFGCQLSPELQDIIALPTLSEMLRRQAKKQGYY